MKGYGRIHARSRRSDKREQAAKAEPHHSHSRCRSLDRARSGYGRFDVAYARIDVIDRVQGKALLPVLFRANGEIHVPLLPPEQLRADRDESCRRKFVTSGTEVRVDPENFMQNDDDWTCFRRRARLIRIEAAFR